MNAEMADGLESRLIDFGAEMIQVSEQLPQTRAGKHIADQLLRSGTSAAPHYGEARGSESRADFVHKLNIALKELNETRIWLRMVVRAKLASAQALAAVLDECQQLARIINASVQTARRNARGKLA